MNEFIARETLEKDAAQSYQEVWNQHTVFPDLKRKFPTLGRRTLVNKE